jgi:hypothetical protein
MHASLSTVLFSRISPANVKKGITIANVRNARLRDIQVTGFTGPLLSTVNVSGKGIENASKAEAPAEAALVAASAVPYQLH